MTAAAAVLLAAACSLVLMRFVRADSPAALRLGLAVAFFNVFLLLPVHLTAAANLVSGAGFRPATVLVFQIPLLVLAVVLAWRAAPRRGDGGSAGWLDGVRALRPWVRVAGALVLLSYVVFAVEAAPSHPTGWDGLVYHLPLANRWLQQGSPALPPSLAWPFSLPANAEMLMMLGLASGAEQAAILFNVSAVLLLGSSVFLLARRLGRDREAAVLSVLILLSMPIFAFQFFTTYVDGYAAGFILFAAALFFHGRRAWTSERHGPWLAALMVGVCMGLAVGTKLTTVVYAGIMGVAMTVAVWNRRGWRRAIRFSAVVLAGVALTLAFWVGRAWSTTGNPVYPLEVRVGDHVLFDGIPPDVITPDDYDLKFVRSRAEWLIYPWTEWHQSGYSFGTGQGFGAAFATFVPLALLFLLLRRESLRSPAKVVVALLLVGLLVWWFALQRVPRFALPLLAFSCALAAPLLATLRLRFRRGFPALALLALTTTLATTTIIPALRMARRWRADVTTRAAFYGLPPVVDSLPSGSTILNLGPQQYNHGLAGDCVCNRVVIKWELPDTITPAAVRRIAPDVVVTDNVVDRSMERLLREIGLVRFYADRPSRPEGVALWARR